MRAVGWILTKGLVKVGVGNVPRSAEEREKKFGNLQKFSKKRLTRGKRYDIIFRLSPKRTGTLTNE